MEQDSKLYVCNICYRQFPEDKMKKSLSGYITNSCIFCDDIIGKGAGYSSEFSEEQAEDWLEGAMNRKEELVKQGKL